jgi:plastocyanin
MRGVRPVTAKLLVPALGLLLLACSGAEPPPAATPAGGGTPPAASPSPAAQTPAPGTASPTAGGATPCEAVDDPGTVAVTIEGFAYSPRTVEARTGDIVAWTNMDAAPHTATLDDGSCTTANLGKDGTGALRFSAAGSYGYFCRIHPDMKGTVEVTD